MTGVQTCALPICGRDALVVEIGFRSTRLATFEADVGPGTLDLGEQSRAYLQLARALGRVRKSEEALAGLFLWKWEPDPLTGADAARGFGPRGKPAEWLLGRIFRSD